MGELESIRDIARRLVAEFKKKKTIPYPQYLYREAYDVVPVPEKVTSVAVADPVFDGLDSEWLRKLGIEA